MGENKVIRQISDYTLDELNEHMATVYKIPDYIMDFVRRQYWIDQIKMFKNIILDNIEQKTCMFDRHVKVQKWIDGTKPGYVDKYTNDGVFEINNYGNAQLTKYHNFYFEHREQIETYFMNMLEKTGTATPGLNSKIDIETDVLEKFQDDEKQFLEE